MAPTLALGGCGTLLMNPQGGIGVAEKSILLDSLAIMLAIVVPTIIATLGFAWWYRASNGRARYLPDFAYDGRVEVVTWGVPLLTIMLLGGVTWVGAHQLDPAVPLASKQQPVDVEVVSLDWKWLFIYPAQHIASVNELTVPAGAPVHFSLTSASVMNAFFVPQLGSMIYTMNGMTSQLNLQADSPGTFAGLSSHYSGDGFSDMRFTLHAVPRGEFNAWVQTVRANGTVLDTAAYEKLEQQSAKVAPYTYRDVDPNLFHAIVADAIPAAPGPQQLNPALSVPTKVE
jgi:cytochrome o ubiquinol oxidase subunit 2